MKRIALVTGGTRGLGKAIAVALRDAGCRVAATYHSDDGAARRMQDETSIPALRWDVADFDACRDGMRRVEALLDGAGPARCPARDRRRHPSGPPGYAGKRRRGRGFLASEGSGFITGATFDVNGGQYLN